MQFSDIALQLRIAPVKGLSIVSRASISPYAWDNNGIAYDQYAHKNGQGLGRISSANISTTYTFTAKESRDRINKTQELMGDHWGADFQRSEEHTSELQSRPHLVCRLLLEKKKKKKNKQIYKKTTEK